MPVLQLILKISIPLSFKISVIVVSKSKMHTKDALLLYALLVYSKLLIRNIVNMLGSGNAKRGSCVLF